jgi:hypothetical protein
MSECPFCMRVCNLHYCSCGTFIEFDSHCPSCYCSCGLKLVNSRCPKTVCRCGALISHDSVCCHGCECTVRNCHNIASKNSHCRQHIAQCCEDLDSSTLYIGNLLHKVGCPVFYQNCDCPREIAAEDCTSVFNYDKYAKLRLNLTNYKILDKISVINVSRTLCKQCRKKNKCIVCGVYHTDGTDSCNKCSFEMICPICRVTFRGNEYRAGCALHDDSCILLRCCKLRIPEYHYLTMYGYLTCVVHGVSTVTKTVYAIWVRQSILKTAHLDLPTVAIMLSRIENILSMDCPCEEVTAMITRTRDITFGVGIVINLPKDPMLCVMQYL